LIEETGEHAGQEWQGLQGAHLVLEEWFAEGLHLGCQRYLDPVGHRGGRGFDGR